MEEISSHMTDSDIKNQSKWNAGTAYVLTLQELFTSANRIKMELELNKGDKIEITSNFKTYLSLLRWIYRELLVFMDEEERKKNDGLISDMRLDVSTMEKTIKDGNFYYSNIEKKLEDFQEMLNIMRFKQRLIVPMEEERDVTGLRDFEGIV